MVQCSENGIGGKSGAKVRTKTPNLTFENRRDSPIIPYATLQYTRLKALRTLTMSAILKRKSIDICYNPKKHKMRIYRCNVQ